MLKHYVKDIGKWVSVTWGQPGLHGETQSPNKQMKSAECYCSCLRPAGRLRQDCPRVPLKPYWPTVRLSREKEGKAAVIGMVTDPRIVLLSWTEAGELRGCRSHPYRWPGFGSQLPPQAAVTPASWDLTSCSVDQGVSQTWRLEFISWETQVI